MPPGADKRQQPTRAQQSLDLRELAFAADKRCEPRGQIRAPAAVIAADLRHRTDEAVTPPRERLDPPAAAACRENAPERRDLQGRLPSSTTTPGHTAWMICALGTYSLTRSTSVLSTATARGPSGMAIPSRVSTLASDSSRYGPISKTVGTTSMMRSDATSFYRFLIR